MKFNLFYSKKNDFPLASQHPTDYQAFTYLFLAILNDAMNNIKNHIIPLI
jgi:hypothetical protein